MINEWDPKDIYCSKEVMNARLMKCTDNLGFQHAVKLIKRAGIDYEHLKIAEVGCGTGTFSLFFALLGAKVTLLDCNYKVLENASKIYSKYSCKADIIKANCLDSANEGLREQFDIVVSGGLAEHFQGDDRKKCIDFHKQLVKPDGFIFVGVPNALSLPYWIVRIYRKCTRTWRISLELPFTYLELKKIAGELDFKSIHVTGNNFLRNDIREYSRGLLSAVAESLPKAIYKRLKKGKYRHKKHSGQEKPGAESFDIKDFCFNKVRQIEPRPIFKRPAADRFSAGITLFASVKKEVI